MLSRKPISHVDVAYVVIWNYINRYIGNIENISAYRIKFL